jgi:trehalose-6-phosphate synthase
MNEVPMYYLSQAQPDEALLWVFNNYLAFGIVWFLIGMSIFSTSYQKSKSAAIGGLILSMFLGLINSLIPVEVQTYFTILVGLLLFMVVYKVIR